MRCVMLVPGKEHIGECGRGRGGALEEVTLRLIVVVFRCEERANVVVQRGVAGRVGPEFRRPGNRFGDEAFPEGLGRGDLREELDYPACEFREKSAHESE